MARRALFDDELPKVPAHLVALLDDLTTEQECEQCHIRGMPLYALGARSCHAHLDARGRDAYGDVHVGLEPRLYGCCGRDEHAPCMPSYHVFPSVPRIGDLALVLPFEIVQTQPQLREQINKRARLVTYEDMDRDDNAGFNLDFVYRSAFNGRVVKRGVQLVNPRAAFVELGIMLPPILARRDDFDSIFRRAGVEPVRRASSARAFVYVLPLHGSASTDADLLPNVQAQL